MAKNVVLCLDGTNNKIRSATNTNVVRLLALLDLDDAQAQVAYYDPGVGTFSSPAAWSPPARTASRLAGLAFGAGLRQNLGEAYAYLMSAHEPGDRVFVFGFSRGAYTARALAGMLEVFGLFRRGSENLVPYAVEEYTKRVERRPVDWEVFREYARIHGRDLGRPQRDHAPLHFVGLWDTVKAAGHLRRQLKWPYTRQLPHAAVVRHAVSIDEQRRPYAPYLLHRSKPTHLVVDAQDHEEVWFAGVHSDVGGTFADGARLSDIPLKWMAEQAVAHGLRVHRDAYDRACDVSDAAATDAKATGAVHTVGRLWGVLGYRRRAVPEGARVHASVARRVEADPGYARHLPASPVYVDEGWSTPSRQLSAAG